ncbi:CYTH domain-containing protein [Bacillus sp. 2205SS5-2]|uniref:CYTH domain-containing protein n=1 Tax=Bacillus sp. 2205SS5-2 TaxID=3109031 RepID=UPI00300591E7
MNQEIEIEYKNLLDEQEFNLLLRHFSVSDEQFSTQENFYFDTEDYFLKEKGCAIRIRTKNHQHILTLKQPLEVGILETHQPLTNEEKEKMLDYGLIPQGQVKEALESISLPLDSFTYFGSLQTKRAQVNYKRGTLFFDQSHYLSKIDYEVEYEVQDPEEGKTVFLTLLRELNIPTRQTHNKIKRFFLAKIKKQL